QDRDLSFAFQVQMELEYEAGFIPRPNRRGEGSRDTDLAVFALQFRDKVEWAVGHNVSVAPPEIDDGEVRRLRTTHLPHYEVRNVRHRDFPDVVLTMRDLARLEGDALRNALFPL